jgi:hypothetical protein
MADLAHPDYALIKRRLGVRALAEIMDTSSDVAAVRQFLAEDWDVDLRTTHAVGEREDGVVIWACFLPVGDPYPRGFYAAVFPDGHVEDWTRLGCCFNTQTGCGHEPRARWLR